MEQNKMDASVFNSATWRFDVYLVKTILNSEKNLMGIKGS